MTVAFLTPSCRSRSWKVSTVTRIGCGWDEILVTVDGFGATKWEKRAQSDGFDLMMMMMMTPAPQAEAGPRKKQAQENQATGGEGVTNHCRQQGGGPNRDRIDR